MSCRYCSTRVQPILTRFKMETDSSRPKGSQERREWVWWILWRNQGTLRQCWDLYVETSVANRGTGIIFSASSLLVAIETCTRPSILPSDSCITNLLCASPLCHSRGRKIVGAVLGKMFVKKLWTSFRNSMYIRPSATLSHFCTWSQIN